MRQITAQFLRNPKFVAAPLLFGLKKV